MKRYIEGDNRHQTALLPACLEDYISEDNPVRLIDVFVDGLDLKQLGFGGTLPASTGRPRYHPAALLKLYVYGYLNRLQSSRRLERETQRNLELMWLLGRLSPDFKTIAEFRKANGAAIRQVGREFIDLCRRLEVFSEAIVAIDGSKFKAVNHQDKNFTENKLKARIKQIEASVGRYLLELGRADREPALVSEARVQNLEKKLEAAKAHIKKLRHIQARLPDEPDEPDGQLSLTDPDARAMASSGQGTGIVGYNVQAAVDVRHHLIVAHEVTNVGHDRTTLRPMAEQTRQAVGSEQLTALADRGYFNGPELAACEQAGLRTLVPNSNTSGNRAAGLFEKQDFRYIPEANEYECPAGQRAVWRFKSKERGQTIHRYWSSACPGCAMKASCTVGKYRRISRSEHQEVLDRVQARLDQTPGAMRIRRQTVEHPFGTIKAWMGATHFLTRTLPRVSAEMSLHVLAYNLKRAMRIFGVQPLIRAISA